MGKTNVIIAWDHERGWIIERVKDLPKSNKELIINVDVAQLSKELQCPVI